MKEYNSVRLPLHFDVTDHQFDISDYITVLNTLKIIVEQVDRNLFGGKNCIELLIVAEEDGSFKPIFKITAFFGLIWLLIQISESDFVSGFIKGLTGHDYNVEEIGQNTGEFIKEIVVKIIETTTDDLERCIPTEMNFDKAIHAKSNFYKMCIRNDKIKGIGFDDSQEFPIKRKDFISRLAIDKEVPIPSEFRLLKNMVIISPVDVDIDRNWRLRNPFTKSEITAKMRDETFKHKFFMGKYPLKKTRKDDVITVLIEIKKSLKNGEIIQKDIYIKEVYSFNGTIIKEIPKFFHETQNGILKDERPFDELW